MPDIFDRLLVSCPNEAGGLFLIDHDKVRRIDTSPSTGLAIYGNRTLRGIQPGTVILLGERPWIVNDSEAGVDDIHDVVFKDGCCYVVGTTGNKIIRLDGEGQEVETWTFADADDSWHINCLGDWNDRIVFSAFGDFSTTRGYKKATAGAGFVRDLLSGDKLIDGLSQPHSLVSCGENLIVANSEMKEIREYAPNGTLLRTAQFDGYTRGISVGEEIVYIGLSCSRNVSDTGVSTAIVVAIDRATWAEIGRIALPSREIYDIRQVVDRDTLLAVTGSIGEDVVARLTDELRKQHIGLEKIQRERDEQTQREREEQIQREREEHARRLDEQERVVEKLNAQLAGILNSRSWRWTDPLRKVEALIAQVKTASGAIDEPILQRLRRSFRELRLYASLRDVRNSELFDSDYYRTTYPDVPESGLDPATHFLVHGWKEYRNPSTAFDTAFYLSENPDIAIRRVNPLLHYLRHGRQEGRQIRKVRLADARDNGFSDHGPEDTILRREVRQSGPGPRRLIRQKLSRLGTIFSALRPALSFYQGSPLLAIRRVAGVFRREGIGGIVRRAYMLTGRPLVGGEFSSTNLYGDVRPLAADFRPLVSVIVPNYNHAPYLAQRLDSIYRQTYSNLEVILLDDCSSDDSLQVLRDYAARYPKRTICHFNAVNSGGVFNQWKKGLELAKGELIWIAESDDYCSDSFLEEMVRCFQTEGVKLAFSDTEFVRGTPPETIWCLQHYLQDLGLQVWDKSFIRSAHAMVKAGWVAKNLVPNVSSAVFRHPGKIDLFDDAEWLRLRLCGDWVFYLTLVRGGLVAYNPKAINYYRQHAANTSVNAQKEDIYYREHEIVAKRVAAMYAVGSEGFKRQEQVLYTHWCSQRGDGRLSEFQQLYDLERILPCAAGRLPNVLMAVYALAAGGGETFPIMLANELAQKGYAVTVLNCHQQATESGVRAMLSPQVALLELEQMDRIASACSDMGISLVHSHHAWVDMSLAMLLIGKSDISHVISTHGMYEMMTPEQVAGFMPLLRKRVAAFVYTAEKNLGGFPPDLIREKTFRRIDNALPFKPIQPIPRETLGLEQGDFVLCLVARAIPDKGWEEAIKAVQLANTRSPRPIQLLLIGEGPEFQRLRQMPIDKHIHFIGFKANIRDYFAASDMGFLPSRFKGESAPLVLIDCLLSGKPVLASDIGEIRYMLETDAGSAGSLLALQDWSIDTEILAEVIVKVANDPESYARMSSQVSAAAAKFEMAAMVEKYEDVYRSVITPVGRPI
jgi:glycosyltransferase involved in cell wall biosynthesis